MKNFKTKYKYSSLFTLSIILLSIAIFTNSTKADTKQSNVSITIIPSKNNVKNHHNNTYKLNKNNFKQNKKYFSKLQHIADEKNTISYQLKKLKNKITYTYNKLTSNVLYIGINVLF